MTSDDPINAVDLRATLIEIFNLALPDDPARVARLIGYSFEVIEGAALLYGTPPDYAGFRVFVDVENPRTPEEIDAFENDLISDIRRQKNADHLIDSLRQAVAANAALFGPVQDAEILKLGRAIAAQALGEDLDPAECAIEIKDNAIFIIDNNTRSRAKIMDCHKATFH